MSLPPSRTRFIPAAALLALSLLWAAGSLRADLLPNPALSALPPFEAASIPLALLGLAAAIVALLRRAPWPCRRQLLSALWIALGLFVAPNWLLRLANGHLPSLARVALFSLVPVFAVVLEPHFDPDAPHPSFSLAASLAAVLGMLLVFPLDLPISLIAAAAQLALILAAALIAAANCLAARAARTLSPDSLASFTSLVAAFACLALVLSGALTGSFQGRLSALVPALVWSSLLALPALALLFWLLPRFSASRMTTRFLFAPLFAAIVSALILEPRISTRVAVGLLLVAAAASWLLIAPNDSPDASSSPLHLTRD